MALSSLPEKVNGINVVFFLFHCILSNRYMFYKNKRLLSRCRSQRNAKHWVSIWKTPFNTVHQTRLDYISTLHDSCFVYDEKTPQPILKHRFLHVFLRSKFGRFIIFEPFWKEFIWKRPWRWTTVMADWNIQEMRRWKSYQDPIPHTYFMTVSFWTTFSFCI